MKAPGPPEPLQWFPPDPARSSFFEANRNAFHQQQPEQAAWLESAIDAVSALEVARIGNDQFACRETETQRELYSPERFQEQLNQSVKRIHDERRRGVSLVLIAGAGLNYLASHIEEEIRGEYTHGLVLIETRPELILAMFTLFDCLALIHSRQVFWALGDTLVQVATRERFGVLHPRQIVMVPERELQPVERESFRILWQGFQKHVLETGKVIETQQAAFNTRMADSPNLDSGCIWGFVNPKAYAHTPLAKAFASGFSQQGWSVELLELEDGFSARSRIGESMVLHRPDVLLFCNAPSGEFVSEQIQRPRITLMMDDPGHFNRQAYYDHLGPMDTILYMERTWGTFFAEMTNAHSYFMPVYPSLTRIGERIPDLHTPIVFVGSHTPVSELLQECPTKYRESIEALVDAKLAAPRASIEEVFQKTSLPEECLILFGALANHYTDRIPRTFYGDSHRMGYFLYALANSMKRERYLTPLLDLGMQIYGPESWLKFLGDSHAPCFRGWLPEDRLPDVYASADICINLHSLQCPTCLNVRDFDVLHAGGCLVGDWVEDAEAGLLTDGHDMQTARSVEGIRDEIERLLDDEHAREALRQQGHTTCLERHQPLHRVKQVFPSIKTNWDAYRG